MDLKGLETKMSQGHYDLLPILKTEKSYREWRKAMSMWDRVTDVEPAKRALVFALNLSGKPREWALEMHVAELNSEDGLTKLLNRLDRMHNRLETYRIYHELDRLHKSPSQCMDACLYTFRTLSSKAKEIGLVIPPSFLSCKLLAQSGLYKVDQENIFCQVEELTISDIATALRYDQTEISSSYFNYIFRERQDLRCRIKDAGVKDVHKPNMKPGPDVFWSQRSASDSTSPAFKFDLTMAPSTSKLASKRSDKNSNEALLSFSPQPERILERDVKQTSRRLKDAQTQCSILTTPRRREHRLRHTVRRIERDLLGEDFEQVIIFAVRFASATITQLFRQTWVHSVEASASKRMLLPEISNMRTPVPTFSFAKTSINFTGQNKFSKPAFFGKPPTSSDLPKLRREKFDFDVSVLANSFNT